MIKKNLLGLIGLLLLFVTACNNSGKKVEAHQDSTQRVEMNNPEEIQQISEVITRFARAYLSEDNGKINALIHPEHGIAVIHRPGAADTYTIIDSIDFKNPMPHYYAYPVFVNNQVLTFESLPSYDCGTMKWDKIGFFCDTTATTVNRPLEAIAKFLEEFEDTKFDAAEKKEIAALEDGAYRVILAQENDHLIFHVKKFDKGWYVTILDRAYAGCDA